MPRIESIARSSPTRSSSVRCSADTSGPLRAVSVAIWRNHPFLVGAVRDPPARRLILAARAGSPPRVVAVLSQGYPPRGASPRAGRAALDRADALAHARRMAVAGLLRPHGGGRDPHQRAAALRGDAAGSHGWTAARRLREPAP